jgi:hypothetical protein
MWHVWRKAEAVWWGNLKARPSRSCVNSIVKVDLQGKGWEMDWIDLAQDKDKRRCLVKAVINFLFCC